MVQGSEMSTTLIFMPHVGLPFNVVTSGQHAITMAMSIVGGVDSQQVIAGPPIMVFKKEDAVSPETDLSMAWCHFPLGKLKAKARILGLLVSVNICYVQVIAERLIESNSHSHFS